jgi:rRNA-processing protein FCF1
MDVFLDTNFIISCIRRKIDFIEELKVLGFKPVLLREVYQELKDLRLNVSSEEKSAIEVAIKIFEKNEIKKGTIGNVSVDMGLIEKGRLGHYIATLDAAIKRQIKNRVIINNSKNNIEVERD